MINKLMLYFKYVKYFLFSHTKHDVHSPFVFDLITWVIEDKTPYYIYRPIESLRSKLLISDKKISITDLGAGSLVNKARTRKISEIAKNSVKSAKYGQLLFRLVRHFKPDTILELGTSLGITTLYLASPRKTSTVVTLEGCPATASLAQTNIDALNIKNIQLITGDFKDTLPKALAILKKPDLVFFDGNHQKEATLLYFHQCLASIENDTVFIFDDIYWSTGMHEAWEEIKSHSLVTVTIDLFFIGIVFFRKEQEKQHFVIKF
jgi:predicted O-methyltransferase YrrM